MVRPRKISDIKPLFTKLAQTSHYEVKFGGLPPQLLRFLLSKGVDPRFVGEDAGLLCSSASLPTSNLATANIAGSYTGMTENFAHTRQYQQISLEFYVDNNYKSLIFLESWMEFIASGSYNPQGLLDPNGLPSENPRIDQNQFGYFTRMQYPDFYKANGVKITKFERDYNRSIEYNFLGMYPFMMNSPSVSYGPSDTLKVNASFYYDRYIAGKWSSISAQIGDNNNNQYNSPAADPNKPRTPASASRPSVAQSNRGAVLFQVNDATTTRVTRI